MSKSSLVVGRTDVRITAHFQFYSDTTTLPTTVDIEFCGGLDPSGIVHEPMIASLTSSADLSPEDREQINEWARNNLGLRGELNFGPEPDPSATPTPTPAWRVLAMAMCLQRIVIAFNDTARRCGGSLRWGHATNMTVGELVELMGPNGLSFCYDEEHHIRKFETMAKRVAEAIPYLPPTFKFNAQA